MGGVVDHHPQHSTFYFTLTSLSEISLISLFLEILKRIHPINHTKSHSKVRWSTVQLSLSLSFCPFVFHKPEYFFSLEFFPSHHLLPFESTLFKTEHCRPKRCSCCVPGLLCISETRFLFFIKFHPFDNLQLGLDVALLRLRVLTSPSSFFLEFSSLFARLDVQPV